MFLRRLSIRNFRNIRSVSLDDLATVNILYGENGSGKTSVLEAMNVLGLGRPFRRGAFRPVIREREDKMTVYGEMLEDTSNGGRPLSIGIERSRRGGSQIRIGAEANAKAGDLVDYLPLQVIGAQVFKLLEGGPVARREFMDWGVFHVEPQFRHDWRRFKRALTQRNIALRKDGVTAEELEPWSRECADASTAIDGQRRRWRQVFAPIFAPIVRELLRDDVGEVDLDYQSGWDPQTPLLEDYQRDWRRDVGRGHTRLGAHRADLGINVNGRPALEALSRGQQKLLTAALRLAQGALLRDQIGKCCLFLVDDLPAELDRERRRRFCGALERDGHQVFVSCIEEDGLSKLWANSSPRMFHVKQGHVMAVDRAAAAPIIRLA